MYTLASILPYIHTKRQLVHNAEQPIYDLAYDSRKIRNAGYSLFFALKNVRDGHTFIPDAYQKGVRAFVVSHDDIDTSLYPDASFFWVDDVLSALQELARYHRKKFKKPVIGITGSNGKTIVKEWLAQLLQEDKKVYQSPKSYNSQLGVALSLWNLSDDYDCAIIEAGISLPGEMDHLQAMICPDIGIMTNIGVAHADGFASKTLKITEKLKLFKHTKNVIFPSRYGFEEYLPAETSMFTFGEGDMDEVKVLRIEERRDGCSSIQVSYRQEIVTFTVPFVDKASIENVLICLTTLLFLDYPLDTILHKLGRLRPLEMRLQLKKGRNNCSIIDDTYSNDLASLQIALDFLDQQQQHKKKTLILSDMDGLNDHLEAKLLSILRQQNLNRIIMVGKSLSRLQDKLGTILVFFDSTEELMRNLGNMVFENESILIKGSRRFHLEDVSKLLVAKSHETVLEINLSALEHNLQVYRSMLPLNVKLMVMVKAFSYGSGSYEVANLLQFNKVDYLTVAFADEGVELRQHGIDLPIMVLSPDEQVFESLLTSNLEPEIYSFRILRALIDFLRIRKQKAFPVHIKIDTGMHRLGFLPDEMDELTTLLSAAPEIKVKTVFSHLVASGNKQHDDFTIQQISLFSSSADKLEEMLGYRVFRHIANTSGIVNWPSAYMDMVRLGIGLYGVDMDGKLTLEQVSELKTTITQIKKLPAGATVGYDRKGLLSRPSRIATVKIGYADGYSRRFGGGVGEMSINGQRARTVGSICMDMCMLDVTDIAAQELDEVVVFPDLTEAAQRIGTIPYELLVNIAARVKRVYFYG
ncbi:bifunctional UDP-N-acetylmuramoyl-tripeptide:D-alanyl-D-alanine ligase/alanine racemase [Sphingobacterium sp. SGR-19]|uniref:bifunctional UDP-N-acetylmuramoyl-tripeptide:D-alanyl-D-alanine ligase/alanine racemase n=1 Tax=Sphingobacterium sp. SGR-19 TaxID=2710886 RepID=UPI0013EA2747|nr:bifunctional UDP-N-acetylmuramoyl-tripeptide:D-alanyl-D-alanine ligase/alanine racemase [Sphingobacterium sp. SGR-19]NGM64046.1 bifunctional UDP-N-acetylmuramoyl-tripeptide:D-alanyl-D-alanine ligase/alanine racemase [Sphingobacterium sp. SGR-19]